MNVQLIPLNVNIFVNNSLIRKYKKKNQNNIAKRLKKSWFNFVAFDLGYISS